MNTIQFNQINLLKSAGSSCVLEQRNNVKVCMPDVVKLFRDKYTKEEIHKAHQDCMFLLEKRVLLILNVLQYILGKDFEKVVTYGVTINLDMVNIIARYNNALEKKYTEPNICLSEVDSYLVDKYSILEATSFSKKEYISSSDFMISYIFFLLDDYDHSILLTDEVTLFFNNLTSTKKETNNFFSFLFFQYEYYFFLNTLSFFLCHSFTKKLKQDNSYVDYSINKASMLLNISFAKSNKGLYHCSSSLSDPFLGFLELHIKDLYLLLNEPGFNYNSFCKYIEDKYGDIIYPFCIIDSNGQVVFYIDTNMIDFNYMLDFINSYLRLILNTNSQYLFNNIKEIKKEMNEKTIK